MRTQIFLWDNELFFLLLLNKMLKTMFKRKYNRLNLIQIIKMVSIRK